MKVLLCAIAKQENHYVREWVEWYKNIGIDHIVLYDNNHPKGERFDEVIGDYIRDGYVEVIDYRGESQCQKNAYTSCYTRYGNQYDWLLFLDLDELLYINKSTLKGDVKVFLGKDIFANCKGIKVSWKCMSDNGKLKVEYGDYSMYNRFKEAAPRDRYQNRFAKMIVRGKQGVMLWKKSVHHPAHLDPVVDVLGNPTTNKNKFPEPIWKSAYILHYRFKTIEEYVTNKMQRLYPDQDDEKAKAKLNLDYFFEINERTEEKERYAQELLSKM